jgi:uncharacterized protein (DUF1015 family)
MRATRFRSRGAELAGRLSPPYDVIDAGERSALLAGDERNIVELILPDLAADGLPDYRGAAQRLSQDLAVGVLAADDEPALYVYEMATAQGSATRGLLGAVRLHEAQDGVIFPHENTMAGPVADRLALMEASQANLEPIYLIYDGGGPAADAVAQAAAGESIADATLPDGSRHRLWRILDPAALERVRSDLGERTAVIADGHHRYATYLALQRRASATSGRGPWDRGLALLVDSTTYGPQVEAIHRVVPHLPFPVALAQARAGFAVDQLAPRTAAGADQRGDGEYATSLLAALRNTTGGFAVVITDAAALLAGLDVSIVHTNLVATRWGRPDTVEALLYAHSAPEAIALARANQGVAILLRPTPVDAVLTIARAGLRMPRKSTLFLPKPASGMALRLFADQPGES